MDTFRPPPRPLPYDDPRFSPPMVQHPIVSGQDKASTHFQKPGQLTERKTSDTGSACTAQKVESVKHHSGCSRIDVMQVPDSYDEDDCPICLEGWWKQWTPVHKLSFCRFDCLACMNIWKSVKPCSFSCRRKYTLLHLNHSKYERAKVLCYDG